MSAEVDGRLQTVNLMNTHLVLVIEVSDATGVDGVAPEATVRVAVPWASGVAGAPIDTKEMVSALREKCPLGTTVRIYPQSVSRAGEATATMTSIVLVANDGRIVSFDPLVPVDKPFGVTRVEELTPPPAG